jgi:hypothetical protein
MTKSGFDSDGHLGLSRLDADQWAEALRISTIGGLRSKAALWCEVDERIDAICNQEQAA